MKDKSLFVKLFLIKNQKNYKKNLANIKAIANKQSAYAFQKKEIAHIYVSANLNAKEIKKEIQVVNVQGDAYPKIVLATKIIRTVKLFFF